MRVREGKERTSGGLAGGLLCNDDEELMALSDVGDDEEDRQRHTLVRAMCRVLLKLSKVGWDLLKEKGQDEVRR